MEIFHKSHWHACICPNKTTTISCTDATHHAAAATAIADEHITPSKLPTWVITATWKIDFISKPF
jgi:hypothetical protein